MVIKVKSRQKGDKFPITKFVETNKQTGQAK